MAQGRRMTPESVAPIERVWEALAGAVHAVHADTVAGRLVDALHVDLLTIRSDARRPRRAVARPHRTVGAMLLGAAWLSGSPPRD